MKIYFSLQMLINVNATNKSIMQILDVSTIKSIKT